MGAGAFPPMSDERGFIGDIIELHHDNVTERGKAEF
jgi:hypothetical protein